MTEQIENVVYAELNGAITAAATSLTLDSGAALPATGDFRIRIGDELMLVTARASNVLTVTRGIEGTTATSHADEAVVKMVHSAAALKAYVAENGMVARGVSCRLTSQTVSASAWTPLNWDTLIYETAASMWDISQPGRLYADADGLWLVTYTWWWNANVNGQRYNRIRVNGVVHTGEVDWLGPRTDVPLPYNTRTRVLDLNSGDYVQLQIYQDTTGNLDVNYGLGELTYLGSR